MTLPSVSHQFFTTLPLSSPPIPCSDGNTIPSLRRSRGYNNSIMPPKRSSGSSSSQRSQRPVSQNDVPEAFRDLLRETRRQEMRANLAAATEPPRSRTQSLGPRNDSNVSTRSEPVNIPTPGRGRGKGKITSNLTRDGSPISSRVFRPENALGNAWAPKPNSISQPGPSSWTTVGRRSVSDSSGWASGRPEASATNSPGRAVPRTRNQSNNVRFVPGDVDNDSRSESQKRKRSSLDVIDRKSGSTSSSGAAVVNGNPSKIRKLDGNPPKPDDNIPSLTSTSQSQAPAIENGAGSSSAIDAVLDTDSEQDDDESDYSDDDSDSDIDWEDVCITRSTGPDSTGTDPYADNNDSEVIHVVIDNAPSSSINPVSFKKKKSSTVTRQSRILMHKLHFLCLLWHGAIRNEWCNTVDLQVRLSASVGSKPRKWLRGNSEWARPQRNQLFVNALTIVREMWSDTFRITERGLRAPEYPPLDSFLNSVAQGRAPESKKNKQPVAELAGESSSSAIKSAPASTTVKSSISSIHRETKMDFLRAGDHLTGSPDVGAQLLCALFRGLGLEARLVFSLQVLPLSGPKPKLVADIDQGRSTTIGTFRKRQSRQPGVERIYLDRLDPEDEGADSSVSTISRETRPVFWVEVLNPTSKRWISIDAMSTLTVDKPTALEPPNSLRKINTMTYVLAYEQDGTVVDVTRRYSRTYNARIRRLRVDNIEAEKEWLEATLKRFTRRALLVSLSHLFLLINRRVLVLRLVPLQCHRTDPHSFAIHRNAINSKLRS